MESNLVLEFMNESRCDDVETAYTYLQSNCWDVNAALESWRYLHAENKEDSNNVESNEVKKLSRGISRATNNLNLVSRARCEFAQNFKQNPCLKVSDNCYFIDTPEYTFTLPDLTIYGEEFRRFLDKDLIENSTLVSLEQSGRLNWWIESGGGLCQRLWPLATTGDGNCLLHAASLAMWGFHDRLLILRRALHSFLERSEHTKSLYRRWRWQQTKLNQQSGFVYTEDEWRNEWTNIVNMASTEPRKNSDSSTTYESLEEIHVLALAHVLRRPIIVVADVMLRDVNNEPFAPIPFGGVYLPHECPSSECYRSPLLLTYDMAHFSALVAMESQLSADDHTKSSLPPYAVIPLTDSDGVLLTVQFCVDPGPNHDWSKLYDQTYINNLIPSEREQINLLREYLDVVDLSDTVNGTEIDSEEEIEKRYAGEVTTTITTGTDAALDTGDNSLFGNKNRAAKQLQSVAKQFGSIGKSMSKKLKKNFGSITRIAKTKKNENLRNRILCAEIHTKRHEYQEEMVKNYLLFAQKRFLAEQRLKLADKNSDNFKLQEQALLEGPLKCINANCNSFGTVLTSYMCQKCYQTQRNEEELTKVNTDSSFGTGRSKFYRDPDIESYDAVKNMPTTKSNLNPDRTLYLSKSTFYYDNEYGQGRLQSDNTITYNQPNNLILNNVTTHKNEICGQTLNRMPESGAEDRNNHISKFDFGYIDTFNHNILQNNNNNRKNIIKTETLPVSTNINGKDNNKYTYNPNARDYKNFLKNDNVLQIIPGDINKNKDKNVSTAANDQNLESRYNKNSQSYNSVSSNNEHINPSVSSAGTYNLLSKKYPSKVKIN